MENKITKEELKTTLLKDFDIAANKILTIIRESKYEETSSLLEKASQDLASGGIEKDWEYLPEFIKLKKEEYVEIRTEILEKFKEYTQQIIEASFHQIVKHEISLD